MDTITLRSGVHGTYQCTPESLDLIMAQYLPASVEEVRMSIEEIVGEPYPLTSVTEGLMVLAELRGHATN